MDILIFGALVMGLVQIVKTGFALASRYIPIVTLIITTLLVITYVRVEHVVVNWELIQNGFIIALSAMGIWSGGKAVIGK